MSGFVTLSARAVRLLVDDIDTDQIIPARFLKVTDKKGLGEKLFADWRTRPDFPLNHPDAKGSEILLAGINFGCGSSREHAPWALCDWGIRAVIARSFADIFRQNALKNGLLPVALDEASHAQVVALTAADPKAQLRIDLPNQRVELPDGSAFAFPIDPFSKHCLENGLDELGYILSLSDRITAYEAEKTF
ncbi:3-isopropylmalate dehydratase small subunit [Pendulispora albinea]|uniref:3-isopropylmalate dehydratase small subunit n=1 Tax=Pendulispora albinea TaxID=2741071 RepID=A0ABZ2M8J1_9BACT